MNKYKANMDLETTAGFRPFSLSPCACAALKKPLSQISAIFCRKLLLQYDLQTKQGRPNYRYS